MKVADNLRVALSQAMEDAHTRRHEFLTLEHVLRALHDPTTVRALRAAGADVGRLESELEKYLDREVEQLPEDKDLEPQQTRSFGRVFPERTRAQHSGREELDSPAVLLELMREDEEATPCTCWSRKG